MAYIAPADFRASSLAEFCTDLAPGPGEDALSTQEATDPQLTAAIARFTDRLDNWCNDHFEPEAGLTFDLDGTGTSDLYLPKRIRTITSVSTRDLNGNLTVQAAGVYRARSSLDASGAKLSREFIYDVLELVPGRVLVGVSSGIYYPYPTPGPPMPSAYVWPPGPQTVQVAGDFSWASTPPEIKRALALLVYDFLKPDNPNLRRAIRYATSDASYELAATSPTGIPEADQIIEQYRKQEPILL